MLSVPFTLYFPGCVSSSCPVTLVLFLSLITQLLSSQALSVSPLASSTSVLPFHSFLFHPLLVVTLSPPGHFFVGSSLTCVFELPLFFLSVDVCCCLSVLKYLFGLSFLKLFFKFFFCPGVVGTTQNGFVVSICIEYRSLLCISWVVKVMNQI